jgi:hypothetical protein
MWTAPGSISPYGVLLVGPIAATSHAARRATAATRFWLLVPGSLGLIGVTQLIGADSSAAVTVTLISKISIALGIQPDC